MRFYTNVYLRGNKIYTRGFQGGKRFKEEEFYQPYIFEYVPGQLSKYKTLDGRSVKRMNFRSIKDCRDYIKQMDGVRGKEMFGLTHYQYTYINDEFSGEVEIGRAHV